MMAQLLDAAIHIASPCGSRQVSAADFVTGSLGTALASDEMVTEVDLATLAPGAGWGFHEFARRPGDYALAAVAVTLERQGGVARRVRLAVMGLDERARRLHGVEAALEGHVPEGDALGRALIALQAEIAPSADLNASSDYRRHLADVLARRAVVDAWARADHGEAV
jgi:carbon-monoxide dehydrogenase medium subunit